MTRFIPKNIERNSLREILVESRRVTGNGLGIMDVVAAMATGRGRLGS